MELGSYPGGAGNPRGKLLRNAGEAENGTGGLLVLITRKQASIGNLTSNGSKGGNGYPTTGYGMTGGGSGGGSINVFMLNKNSSYDKAKMNVLGGAAGVASGANARPGGAGGSGKISLGFIENGVYVPIE